MTGFLLTTIPLFTDVINLDNEEISKFIARELKAKEREDAFQDLIKHYQTAASPGEKTKIASNQGRKARRAGVQA